MHQFRTLTEEAMKMNRYKLKFIPVLLISFLFCCFMVTGAFARPNSPDPGENVKMLAERDCLKKFERFNKRTPALKKKDEQLFQKLEEINNEAKLTGYLRREMRRKECIEKYENMSPGEIERIKEGWKSSENKRSGKNLKQKKGDLRSGKKGKWMRGFHSARRGQHKAEEE